MKKYRGLAAMDMTVDELGDDDLDELDEGGHDEGPVPGTRSVGC